MKSLPVVAPPVPRGHQTHYGPVGRLGRYAATHFKVVAIAWVVLAVVLGSFAPRVESALSGAGWEATGSESVAAREMIDADFGGMSSSALMVVVHSKDRVVGDPSFDATVASARKILARDARVQSVTSPLPGHSISRDGHTAIVQAGAGGSPNEMVAAADDLKGPLHALRTADVQVSLTGASGMWSDFNEANLKAMLRSEVISWPITLGILVLAFGSLVAAGLPLMLTILGLVAAAGSLYLGTQLLDISVWAMNFAMMFALALGIDYALFIVMRFRAARSASSRPVEDAVAETMDTAGKAVLFSGITVLISLSAVMLVPSPAFRSMALGIMLAVLFVLTATLTLLPAVLARLGDRVNKLSLPWVRQDGHRSARFAAWGERLWRRPWAYGAVATLLLLALAFPVLGLRTGMPSIKVVPATDSSRVGYIQVQQALGNGAPGALQIISPRSDAAQVVVAANADPGVAEVMPAVMGARGTALIEVIPTTDPSSKATGATVERLRSALPSGALLGGSVAENHDLEAVLAAKTPLVIGVVMALGFLLLLVALQAPIIAAVGVLTNLLAVGAAFGVARLVFQDGHGSGLLGFEPQGFLDAWGPVFFFAMIFAISMDYTVFLLASAKEHWDQRNIPKDAMVGAVAHSGRVVFAAAAVMVAVFFTFSLSGPLPPKEMGVILGVAVLLDAFLVRLLLLPVLLRLLGAWAWWAPEPLLRVLPRVTFGHA